jgi:hypothetical protein
VDSDDNNHHDMESDSDETNDEDDPYVEPQHGERTQQRRQAQD